MKTLIMIFGLTLVGSATTTIEQPKNDNKARDPIVIFPDLPLEDKDVRN